MDLLRDLKDISRHKEVISQVTLLQVQHFLLKDLHRTLDIAFGHHGKGTLEGERN